MRPLKVLALVHKELQPPDDTSRYGTDVAWKMEFDVVETLERVGHEVAVVGLDHDLRILQREIDRWRPQVLFNLLEDFHGIAVNDQHWVSHLELIGVPYTGCNPRGLMLARDKAISKKLLAYDGIATPWFEVFRRGAPWRQSKDAVFPSIVKSLTFDGSVGISQASVVGTERAMAERVRFIHERIGTDAIVEEYVDGRELYVGLVGHDAPETFPVWELRFKRQPKSTRLIATERVKWSDRYQKKVGVTSARARLSAAKTAEVKNMARRVYRQLELSGYGRIDFRMRKDGEIFFLEANPNPQLAYGEDFAESAEKGGMSYEALIQKIVELAFTRPGH